MKRAIILSLIFLAGCIQVPETEYSCPGCNILLITIDTVRADHLQCYGYTKNTAPNICKIAEEGVLFEKAISQASYTPFALRAILTGKVISNTEMEELHSFYNTTRHAAEELRDAGYTTAAFTDHHGLVAPDWKGFESFTNIGKNRSSVTSHILNKQVINWLKNNSEKKFFLWVHYFDPHFNYNPLPEYEEMFGYSKETCGRIYNTMDIKEITNMKNITKRELDCIKALYDAEIYYTDKYVGELVGVLDELGLKSKTLLIITADHGEEFLEHGRIGHALTLYTEVLHVPYVIRGPNIKPQRIKENTPTQSIFNIVQNKQYQTGDIISRSYYRQKNKTDLQEYAMLSQNYHLIYLPERRQQFFDISTDPYEQKNNPKHPEKEPMLDRLKKWISDNWMNTTKLNDEQRAVQSEADERLRSLGYVI
ncbi:MAG: sulfatase [Candidatus Woesearchaeota archaeon]